jgi:hypothetical protein
MAPAPALLAVGRGTGLYAVVLLRLRLSPGYLLLSLVQNKAKEKRKKIYG